MTQAHKQMGHTPGPWEIEYRSNHDIRIVANDVPPATIAVMANWLPQHDAERDANARLIAAAPDLYAVLRELFIEGHVSVALAGNPAACSALEARARAALSKVSP